MTDEFYRGWSGGYLAMSKPVQGLQLTSLEAANAICRSSLGAGYEMSRNGGKYIAGMNFTKYSGDTWPDWNSLRGSGWYLWSYEGGPFTNFTRFWVYVNDQPSNCWNSYYS